MELPRYCIIGARPVMLDRTADNGMTCLALDWDTGLLSRNLDYLTRAVLPDEEVDIVGYDEFAATLSRIRAERGLTGEQPWDMLTIELGSEWAPDTPYGKELLHIDYNALTRYEQHCRGMHRTASAQADPDLVRKLVAGLRNAGFPAVPPHLIPPGSALMAVTLINSGCSEQALLHYHQGNRYAGYAALIRLIDRWFPRFRNPEVAAGADMPEGILKIN